MWGLPQPVLHYIEAILADLKQSNLVARICDQKRVTSRIEYYLSRQVRFVSFTDVDYTDQAIAFYAD